MSNKNNEHNKHAEQTNDPMWKGVPYKTPYAKKLAMRKNNAFPGTAGGKGGVGTLLQNELSRKQKQKQNK